CGLRPGINPARTTRHWCSQAILLHHRCGLACPLALGWGFLRVCIRTRLGGLRGGLRILVQPYEVINTHPKDTRNPDNAGYPRVRRLPGLNLIQRLLAHSNTASEFCLTHTIALSGLSNTVPKRCCHERISSLKRTINFLCSYVKVSLY